MDIKLTAPFDLVFKDNPEVVSHLRRKYKNDFVVMDKKAFMYDITSEHIFARDYVLKRKIQVKEMKEVYASSDREAAEKGILEMIEHIFEDVMSMATEEKIFLFSMGGGKITPNKDTCRPEMEIVVKGYF